MKRIYTKHGKTGTKIHEVWKEMHRRCKGNYPKTKCYKDKGITVCDEWASAYSFIQWAEQAGYKEGLQLDRINNQSGYYPNNCRFVTPQENANNRENTIFLEYAGKNQTLWHWSLETGINAHTIRTRIIRGWSSAKALTKKVQTRKK